MSRQRVVIMLVVCFAFAAGVMADTAYRSSVLASGSTTVIAKGPLRPLRGMWATKVTSSMCWMVFVSQTFADPIAGDSRVVAGALYLPGTDAPATFNSQTLRGADTGEFQFGTDGILIRARPSDGHMWGTVQSETDLTVTGDELSR